MNKILF